MPQPSSASRSDDAWPEAAAPAQPSSAPLDEAALQAAVRASLEAGEVDQRVLSEELEALRSVVRRNAGRDLVLDPVAIELVAAIIDVNYRGLNRPPEVWRAIAARIAAVLLDSPESRTRLETLWRRLVEAYGPVA